MTDVVAVGGVAEPRLLDVVFLHGLDGDARGTWTGGDAGTFWPRWLSDDFDGVAVWSVGFDAWSTQWRGSAMPMQDRAVNLMAALQLRGIGQRPLCFVTHSMGGLLAKEILLHAAQGQTEYAVFAKAAKGVVFLGTPHTGSALTGFVERLGALYRATAAVKDLRHNAAHLRHLNDSYRDWAVSAEVGNLVFFEARPTKGVQVVDAASANPGLPHVRPIPVDADHIGICKPADRDSLVYGKVKQFVGQILDARKRPAGENALPLPSSHFTGRDDVADAVVDLVEQRRSAGVPLGVHVFDGMAGVGKTELVVQIGHRIAGGFPDGVLFLDLAGYRPDMEPIPPAQALRLLLAQCGVVPDETQQAESFLRALWRDACAGRRMLVVLDNARDQDQVTPLLPDARDCLVLVTSRTALIGLRACTPRKLEELTAEAAEGLLRSIADLPADRAETEVAEVVHQCGRLPLAIVIAGSMLVHRPGYRPGELAEDLRRERAFLDDLAEDDGSLHIAVHASLRLSYRCLPKSLMTAFRLCAWHPGPEVTEPVLAAMLIVPTDHDHPVRVSDRTIADARRRLLALADRNLLRPHSDTHRFRLHDLVRASGRLLPEDGTGYDREHVLKHLHRAYWATLQRVELWRYGGRQLGGTFTAPDGDLPLVPIPDVDTGDAWVLRERENLMAFVEALGDRPFFGASMLAAQLRDLGMAADAERCYLSAERSSAAIGFEDGRALAVRGCAELAARRGDYATARREYQRARKISRRADDTMGIALAWRGLGSLAFLVDDLDAAEDHLRRASSLLADHPRTREGHPVAVRDHANTLAALGEVEHARGHHRSAFELIARAQLNLVHVGDLRGEQSLAIRLAEVQQNLGDFDGARRRLDLLLREHRLPADKQAEAWWQLGQIEKEIGDPVEAVALFEQVLRVQEKREEPLGLARALLGLADAKRLAGRLTAAAADFECALARSTELSDFSGVADATLGLGDVAQATGDHPRACRLWWEALVLATEVDAAKVAFKARVRLGSAR
ncbi:Tetratricopeptide repeat-containing protein [Amycolatopsis pretoriensis]|uniref:Tetratricopeptide repeat-containing protein n=1 Tax=Amycolatopsis pretoriensis TaxID=218821 RepID=A0A1H5RGJ9_9PSEU|nr:tetratricopeptide repeat protein [Amycolatopsis pretoriensis]SEF37483.1 Tetratricopeptide repeat-containing protein [Amycolatopsis pretoriensis]